MATRDILDELLNLSSLAPPAQPPIPDLVGQYEQPVALPYEPPPAIEYESPGVQYAAPPAVEYEPPMAPVAPPQAPGQVPASPREVMGVQGEAAGLDSPPAPLPPVAAPSFSEIAGWDAPPEPVPTFSEIAGWEQPAPEPIVDLPGWNHVPMVGKVDAPAIDAVMTAYRTMPSDTLARKGRAVRAEVNSQRREELMGPDPYTDALKPRVPGSEKNVPTGTPFPGGMFGTPGAGAAQMISSTVLGSDKQAEAAATTAGAERQQSMLDQPGIIHPAISVPYRMGRSNPMAEVPQAVRYLSDVDMKGGAASGVNLGALVDNFGVEYQDGSKGLGFGNSYAVMRLGKFAKDKAAFNAMLDIPEVQEYLRVSRELDVNQSDSARGRVNADLGAMYPALQPYLRGGPVNLPAGTVVPEGYDAGEKVFGQSDDYIDNPEGAQREIAKATMSELEVMAQRAAIRGDGMMANLAMERHNNEYRERHLSTMEVIENIPRSMGHIMTAPFTMMMSLAAGSVDVGTAYMTGAMTGTTDPITDKMAPLQEGVEQFGQAMARWPLGPWLIANWATGGLVNMPEELKHEAQLTYEREPIMAALDAGIIVQTGFRVIGGMREAAVGKAGTAMDRVFAGAREGSAQYKAMVRIRGRFGDLANYMDRRVIKGQEARLKEIQDAIKSGDLKKANRIQAQLKKLNPEQYQRILETLRKDVRGLEGMSGVDQAAAAELMEAVGNISSLDNAYTQAQIGLAYMTQSMAGRGMSWLADTMRNFAGKPSEMGAGVMKEVADALQGKTPAEAKAMLERVDEFKRIAANMDISVNDVTQTAIMIGANEGDLAMVAKITAAPPVRFAPETEQALSRWMTDFDWTPDAAYIEQVNSAAQMGGKSSGIVAFDFLKDRIYKAVEAGEDILPVIEGMSEGVVVDAMVMQQALKMVGREGPGISEFARVFDAIEKSQMGAKITPEARRQMAIYTMNRLEATVMKGAPEFMEAEFKYPQANGEIRTVKGSTIFDEMQNIVQSDAQFNYETGLRLFDADLLSLDTLKRRGLQYGHNVVNNYGSKQIVKNVARYMKEKRFGEDPASKKMIGQAVRDIATWKEGKPLPGIMTDAEQRFILETNELPGVIAELYSPGSSHVALRQREMLSDFRYRAPGDPLPTGYAGRMAHKFTRKSNVGAWEKAKQQSTMSRSLADSVMNLRGMGDEVGRIASELMTDPVISPATSKFLKQRFGMDLSRMPQDPALRLVEIMQVAERAQTLATKKLPPAIRELLKDRGWAEAHEVFKGISAPLAKKMQDQWLMVSPTNKNLYRWLTRKTTKRRGGIARGHRFVTQDFKEANIVHATAPMMRDEFANRFVNGPIGENPVMPFSSAWPMASNLVQTDNAMMTLGRTSGAIEAGLGVEAGAVMQDTFAYGMRNRFLTTLDDMAAGPPLEIAGNWAKIIHETKKAGEFLGDTAVGTVKVLNPFPIPGWRIGDAAAGKWMQDQRGLVDARARMAQLATDTVRSALEVGLSDPAVAEAMNNLGRRLGIKGEPMRAGYEKWLTSIHKHSKRGAGKAGKAGKAAKAADLARAKVKMPREVKPAVIDHARFIDSDGYFNVEAAKGSLPPLADGNRRFYRATSPGLKHNDVWDQTGSMAQSTNMPGPGRYYTDDLNYANTYRNTYGSRSKLYYVDVPEALVKSSHDVPLPVWDEAGKVVPGQKSAVASGEWKFDLDTINAEIKRGKAKMPLDTAARAGRQAKGGSIGERLDGVFREMYDIIGTEKMQEHLQMAMDKYVNYQDVPRWVEAASSSIFMFPFLKWSAQMVPRATQWILQNPSQAMALMQMQRGAHMIMWKLAGGDGNWEEQSQYVQEQHQDLLPMFGGTSWETGMGEVTGIAGLDETFFSMFGGGMGAVNPLESMGGDLISSAGQMMSGNTPRSNFPLRYGPNGMPSAGGAVKVTPGADIAQQGLEFFGSVMKPFQHMASLPMPGAEPSGVNVSSTWQPMAESLLGTPQGKLRPDWKMGMYRLLGLRFHPSDAGLKTAKTAAYGEVSKQRAQIEGDMGGQRSVRNYWSGRMDYALEYARSPIDAAKSKFRTETAKRGQDLRADHGRDPLFIREMVANADAYLGMLRKRGKPILDALQQNLINQITDAGTAKDYFQVGPDKIRATALALQGDVADRMREDIKRVLDNKAPRGAAYVYQPLTEALGMPPVSEDPIDFAALKKDLSRMGVNERDVQRFMSADDPIAVAEELTQKKGRQTAARAKVTGTLETSPERFLAPIKPKPEADESDMPLLPKEQEKRAKKIKSQIQKDIEAKIKAFNEIMGTNYR